MATKRSAKSKLKLTFTTKVFIVIAIILAATAILSGTPQTAKFFAAQTEPIQPRRAPIDFCGDGDCGATENYYNCPEDCKPLRPICGNGVCEGSENPSNCPKDCATPITQIIYPTDDAFIFQIPSEWNPTVINGQTDDWGVMLTADSPVFVKFDLSSVPSNAQIISATLNFVSPGYTREIHADTAIHSNWDERTLNINNAPEMGERLGVLNFGDVPQTKITFDVTNHVSRNKGGQVSYILSGASSEYIWVVGSKENSNQSLWPYLEVTYI